MSDMLRFLLQSGVSLAVFYICYRLLLKNETYFELNRLILLLSMPAALLVPLLKLPSPFAAIQVPQGSPVSLEPVMGVSSLSIWQLVGIVYIAVAGALFIKFVISLLRLYFLIRKHGVQWNGHIGYVFTDGLSDFTFFNLIFINRNALNQFAFQQIVAHEKIHVRQYHTIDLLLAEFFTIFQWYNPFVWLYKGSIKETHEYIADDAVIAQGCDKAQYQMLMLERFVGARIFDLASNFHESQIKRRITMMKRHQSGKWAWIKPLILLPVIALLVLAFAKPRVTLPTTASEPAMVSAAPLVLPPTFIQQQDVKKDVDKKKIAEYEKKIQALKTKYMELEEMKKEGEDVKKIEKEQKHIKEKVSVLNAELKKMTGSDAKDYDPKKKDQYEKEKQKQKQMQMTEDDKKKQEEQYKKQKALDKKKKEEHYKKQKALDEKKKQEELEKKKEKGTAL